MKKKINKVERYTCGNGEGMFDDKKGYWVTYEDYKDLLDKYKILVNKMGVIPDVVGRSEIEEAADNQFPQWVEDGMGGIAGEDKEHEDKQEAFIWGAEWMYEQLVKLK